MAAALAAALLAAGCMTPPPTEVPAPAPAPASPPPVVQVLPVALPAPPPPPDPALAATRRLLDYHERLRTMGTGELAREHLRLADASAAPEALELALRQQQRRANGDLARALSLLEPLQREDASPWSAPARLLHARLAEQRRLEEQLERQGQQLREQQRRIEQLSSQLEALRAIERSLTARPPAAPPAMPAASAPRSAP